MSNALYLPNWTVVSVQTPSESPPKYVVEAIYDVMPDACTKCGVVGELYRHGNKVTVYRDAPVHGKQTTISVKRARFRCRACEAMAEGLGQVSHRACFGVWTDTKVQTVKSCNEAAAMLRALAEERDRLREAAEIAESWIDRWTKHVGNCRGDSTCECGRANALYELAAALKAPAHE